MSEQYKRITLLPYDLDGLAIACEQYLHNDYARVAHQAAARIRELEAQVAVIYDGNAVYAELDVRAHTRTSAQNVADVLDAVARIWKSNKEPSK